MSAKKVTFEQQLERLEEIVAALEKGDAPLADSLKLFEEGTKLIAACGKQLDLTAFVVEWFIPFNTRCLIEIKTDVSSSLNNKLLLNYNTKLSLLSK